MVEAYRASASLLQVAKWQFRQKDREVQLKTVMKALKSIIKLGGIKGLLGGQRPTLLRRFHALAARQDPH